MESNSRSLSFKGNKEGQVKKLSLSWGLALSRPLNNGLIIEFMMPVAGMVE